MIKSVEEYLRQLKKEMDGCDRATIQDALSDAEEYLRNTLETRPDLAEADALPSIIKKYGAPDEIATAYREIEVRVPTTLAPARHSNGKSFPARFFGVMADPKAWGALLYLWFFALFSGTIYFTWAVTGISLSLGLIVLIIGLPFIGVFVLSVQGIALIEGRVVEALLGVRMPRRPIFPGKKLGWWGRFKKLISDKHTWSSITYMLVQFPLGTFYLAVLSALIGLSLGGMAIPIMELGFDFHPVLFNDFQVYTPVWAMPLTVIGGILLLILTMHLVKALGRMHGALAKALLVKY
jgi:hypothetical protein